MAAAKAIFGLVNIIVSPFDQQAKLDALPLMSEQMRTIVLFDNLLRLKWVIRCTRIIGC
jgi:hypothetical protein